MHGSIVGLGQPPVILQLAAFRLQSDSAGLFKRCFDIADCHLWFQNQVQLMWPVLLIRLTIYHANIPLEDKPYKNMNVHNSCQSQVILFSYGIRFVYEG